MSIHAQLLAMLLFGRLAQARFGRTLQAIRENETRMEALGYPVFRYRLVAFALGGAVAGPIVGYLALAFGWRPAFMIIFAIGIVWMIAWFFIAANSPEKHKKVSQEELKLINKMKEEEVALETIENQTAHSLGYYLKQPIILVTAFAFFCYNYILFFFLSWFPSYLVQQHHLDIKQMSLTTMIPWIVGFVGLALGGYISDKIFKLTGRLLLSRKIVLVVCLLMAAICVGLAGTVSSVVPAVLLMSVSIFFLYVTGAIYWAIIQDVVHKSRVGGASGFIHLIGSVSGIMREISIATSEQMKGIHEINHAVTHLDRMVQQNAELVVESAAAAGALQSQAGDLAETAGHFRI